MLAVMSRSHWTQTVSLAALQNLPPAPLSVMFLWTNHSSVLVSRDLVLTNHRPVLPGPGEEADQRLGSPTLRHTLHTGPAKVSRHPLVPVLVPDLGKIFVRVTFLVSQAQVPNPKK